MSTLQASGNIGLSAGTVDAGVGTVDLAAGNQLDVQANANNLSVQFARFLASAFSIDTPNSQISGEGVSLSGASVDMDTKRQMLDGSIDKVNIESIAGSNR